MFLFVHFLKTLHEEVCPRMCVQTTLDFRNSLQRKLNLYCQNFHTVVLHTGHSESINTSLFLSEVDPFIEL